MREETDLLFLPLSCCTVLTANPKEHSAPGIVRQLLVLWYLGLGEIEKTELPFYEELLASGQSFTQVYKKEIERPATSV